jgi:hypothetical protein
MSEEQKVCTKCGVEKTLSEFRMKKRRTGLFPSSKCKGCTRQEQREAWVKSGKPRLGWSKVPFDQWTPEMREAHRKSKEKQRRKSGAKTRDEIAEEKRKRQELKEAERARIAEERAAKKKMPAGMSAAERFRWRYRNDPEFREKQKTRTIQSKRRVPLWYANQQLGGTSDRRYPTPLLLAKQMQLRIRHQLKEQGHEEH